jgi:hypothetical protein
MLNNQFLLTRTDGRNITILIFMGAANLWKYFVLKFFTSGAGTACPSGAHEFIHSFYFAHVAQSLIFCVVFCK